MAQTGYTPILIYSSSTVSQAPSAGNLTNSTLGSELAINITDGKLFYKDNANAVQVIAWKTTPTTAGGTGLTSYTAGDMLYYATGTALTKLAIGASGRWLGSSGTAPQWNAPAALTKTDDTNVTLTLGGSASTALLNAASLTLGWTGQLATSRGGTGLASFTSGGILYASSTSALTTGTALQFNGKIQGIGAAPSTWFTTYNGLQINTVGGITSNTDFFAFSDNVLVDASGNETFLTNGFATRYRQIASNGKHEWYSTAASGTAGNAATLALLATLFPSGGLSLGNTTDPGATNLSVTGNILGGSGKSFIANGNRTYYSAAGFWDDTVQGNACGVGCFGGPAIGPLNGAGAATDNTINLGSGTYRWKTVFAGTATINTSDANEKQDIASLDDAELAVAKQIKLLIKKFKFKDAVKQKGNNARVHFGVLAQEIESAFAAQNLDASKYGLFCRDEWYEIDGKAMDENMKPYTANTNLAVKKTRLGVRYEELFAFVIAAM